MVARNVLTKNDFRIPGQLGARAVMMLIRMQEVASERGAYNYVEVGSYKGRSLFPHVMDDDCKYALSIDLRPEFTPDERVPIADYHHITAESMVRAIGRHCEPQKLEKLETLTTDSAGITSRTRNDRFDLALIDGEHTNEAAFNDFLNLYPHMNESCIICFDDTHIVYSGVANAISYLNAAGVAHKALFSSGCITALLLGDYAARDDVETPQRVHSTRDQMRTRYKENLIRSHLVNYAAEYGAKDQEVRAALMAALKIPFTG
ncbi:MAG: class I SAM-dependent methyltransferase [Pikeienuella sp.]